MDMDLLVAAAAANFSICMAAAALSRPNKIKKNKGEKRSRTCWIKPIRELRMYNHDVGIVFKEYGLCTVNEACRNYTLMDEACFSELLSYIKSDISRQDTSLRQSVPATEKLAATLCYLTTDENMSVLAKRINLSVAFLNRAIVEVCESIYKHLKTKFMPFPSTKDQWLEIANEFENKWNFPNCLGVLNGIHVDFSADKAEKLSGAYCNSEGTQSIILLTMVDACGRFTFINIGQKGSGDLNTALQSSDLMKILQQVKNHIPETRTMENGLELPYVILADNNFEKLECILTPYKCKNVTIDDKNFNARHANVCENVDVFATLNFNFQALEKVASLNKSKTMKIIQCICLLHNFLIERKSIWYERRVQTNRRKNSPIKNILSSAQKVDIVREAFKDYFLKTSDE